MSFVEQELSKKRCSKFKQLPLENYRVINLGWVAAGPMLGSMLGDLGAEVIKVETHNHVDSMRLSPDNLDRDVDKDPWFHCAVRNQLSITLDFSHSKGKALLESLVKISDIVIENFPPQVLRKANLDYEHLKQINPAIIMISLSGAGQYGPDTELKTYGPSLSGLGGLDNMVGYYGERVLGMQQPYADTNAAMFGCFAVLVALHHREKSGVGQYVDLAQQEALIATIGEAVVEYTISGHVLQTQGNRHPILCPHNNYPCKGNDKWVSIAISTEKEWKDFCRAIGNPAWTKDPRFSDKDRRLKNQEELDRLISEWTANYTHYEVMEILQKAGVAAMPCLDIEERFFDPHFNERKVYLEIEHPTTSIDWIINRPYKISGMPNKFERSPMLGEHNSYVFGELLQLSKDEIDKLIEQKVIY